MDAATTSGLDLPLSPPRIQHKRPPTVQSPALNTPTRQRITSKPKTSSKSPSKSETQKITIGDITVNNVVLVKPTAKSKKKISTGPGKLGGDERLEWYKACVQITLTNCKLFRIKVWTDKKIWLSDQPEELMMHKVRNSSAWKSKRDWH